MELFNVLNSYQCSYEILLDPILQLLTRSNEVSHDQIKVLIHPFHNSQFSVFLLGLSVRSSWR